MKVNNGSVAEGDSGSGEGRGEWGVRGGGGGGQSPRVLMQAAVGGGGEICVFAGVCAHRLAAEGQGGHKVAALQYWHVVCIWRLITATSLQLTTFVVYLS